MKKLFFLGISVVFLFANGLYAETVSCHTINDCQDLLAQTESDLQALYSHAAPEMTGILERRVTQYQAENICCAENEGLDQSSCAEMTSEQKRALAVRLPTIKELVLDGIRRGAMPSTAIRHQNKLGYRLVTGMDEAGNPEEFYYSRMIFRPISGALGEYWVWSSSLLRRDLQDAYLFDGKNVAVDPASREYDGRRSAVRCVIPR